MFPHARLLLTVSTPLTPINLRPGSDDLRRQIPRSPSRRGSESTSGLRTRRHTVLVSDSRADTTVGHRRANSCVDAEETVQLQLDNFRRPSEFKQTALGSVRCREPETLDKPQRHSEQDTVQIRKAPVAGLRLFEEPRPTTSSGRRGPRRHPEINWPTEQHSPNDTCRVNIVSTFKDFRY